LRNYSISIGTDTTAVYAAGVADTWTAGRDDSVSRTFSYEGTVEVLVLDTDTKEGR